VGNLILRPRPVHGWRLDVDNFLVDIRQDRQYNTYIACYSNGVEIELAATTYHDAVLEADSIEPYDYQGA
jgi:hypothetical protein